MYSHNLIAIVIQCWLVYFYGMCTLRNVLREKFHHCVFLEQGIIGAVHVHENFLHTQIFYNKKISRIIV